MLTIAAIAALVATSSLTTLPDQILNDAQHTVLFARDPAHLGEEPHLRFEVDACGLDDDALVSLDSAIWSELADRNERAVETRLVDLAAFEEIFAGRRQLALAA